MQNAKAQVVDLPGNGDASVSGAVVRQLLRDFGPWVLVAGYVLLRLDQHLLGLQTQLGAVAFETGKLRVVCEQLLVKEWPVAARPRQ